MFSKSLIAAALTLVFSQAHAHLEKGTYKGADEATGSPCYMTVGEQTFEGIRHPLNERVEVSVNNLSYKVGHPPILTEWQGVTSFNHDGFQGILGVPGGANSLFIEMSHEEGKEGPVRFVLYENSWNQKDDEKVTHCLELALQK